MTGKVLELWDALQPDRRATQIVERYMELEGLRQIAKNEWEEVRRYVYATNTRQTGNSRLPWKNSTTIPKLCQIRDNLYSNYTATLFPQQGNWLEWIANERDSNSQAKRDAIKNYMSWVIDQPSFKHEMDKIIMDYIDFGNCIGTVEWVDERVELPGKIQAGYVGPAVRRISPLDIVFNPTAENFTSSPKIIRSIISLGELRKLLEQMSNDENRTEYEELYAYLKEIRVNAATFQGDWVQRDNLFNIDGFTSFRDYLKSDVVEVITFYGDIYDRVTDTFDRNVVVTVVDRHKLINQKPNPSYFGYAPIFHAPWRKRQDNLWGMGPLANLVGMQYRLDHIENMRSDVVDLTTVPVQMITGFVEDFTWQPGEKIYGSDEGKVELLTPETNVLQANFDLQRLETTMEEMAGAPREAMGFRTPGEKTKYEVQRLENAAARLYQNKIKQFEEQIVEPLLNAMLELARRNMTGPQVIPVFDNELKVASFAALTVQDITGIGRIKPIAARHAAEQADLIQNLTNLTASNLWPMVQPHFSGVTMSQILERVFNLEDYGVVTPYVGLSEQAEAQKLAHALQENVVTQAKTASGIGTDFDLQPAPPTLAGRGAQPGTPQ